jgi:hypothetical protein
MYISRFGISNDYFIDICGPILGKADGLDGDEIQHSNDKKAFCILRSKPSHICPPPADIRHSNGGRISRGFDNTNAITACRHALQV